MCISILSHLACLYGGTCVIWFFMQQIPFDKITKFMVKSPGEVYPGLGCCCMLCCGICLRIPWSSIGMDTGSAPPKYWETCMWGLFDPNKLQRLVWGMKRDKGEQVMKSMHSLMMFDHQQKYGANPPLGAP
jgi:hypothetical protein